MLPTTRRSKWLPKCDKQNKTKKYIYIYIYIYIQVIKKTKNNNIGTALKWLSFATLQHASYKMDGSISKCGALGNGGGQFSKHGVCPKAQAKTQTNADENI